MLKVKGASQSDEFSERWHSALFPQLQCSSFSLLFCFYALKLKKRHFFLQIILRLTVLWLDRFCVRCCVFIVVKFFLPSWSNYWLVQLLMSHLADQFSTLCSKWHFGSFLFYRTGPIWRTRRCREHWDTTTNWTLLGKSLDKDFYSGIFTSTHPFLNVYQANHDIFNVKKKPKHKSQNPKFVFLSHSSGSWKLRMR